MNGLKPEKLRQCLVLLRKYSGVKFSTEPIPLRSLKVKSRKNEVKGIIDVKRVVAVGGSGGNGCISFLRLWANDRAGPDGGDGGNGAHVLFQACNDTHDFSNVPSLIKGQDGEKGQNCDCHGKSAPHTFIKVPLGTVLRTDDGEVLGELTEEGALWLAARGGAGGRGNAAFASATLQAPSVAQAGANGQHAAYRLHLHSIANFALIGLVNAGKSSLLSAMTRARPQVSATPFTTRVPHLGVVKYSDYEQLTDLPGMVEGSHRKVGLGSEWLRHAERCTALLLVVDASVSPVNDLQTVHSELELFNPALLERPHIIVANKIDLPSSQENFEDLKKQLGGSKVVAVSAKFGTNVSSLLSVIRQIYDERLGASQFKDCFRKS